MLTGVIVEEPGTTENTRPEPSAAEIAVKKITPPAPEAASNGDTKTAPLLTENGEAVPELLELDVELLLEVPEEELGLPDDEVGLPEEEVGLPDDELEFEELVELVEVDVLALDDTVVPELVGCPDELAELEADELDVPWLCDPLDELKLELWLPELPVEAVVEVEVEPLPEELEVPLPLQPEPTAASASVSTPGSTERRLRNQTCAVMYPPLSKMNQPERPETRCPPSAALFQPHPTPCNHQTRNPSDSELVTQQLMLRLSATYASQPKVDA